MKSYTCHTPAGQPVRIQIIGIGYSGFGIARDGRVIKDRGEPMIFRTERAAALFARQLVSRRNHETDALHRRPQIVAACLN